MVQEFLIDSWLLPCSLRSHRIANPRQKMGFAIFRLCQSTTLIQANSKNHNTLGYTEFLIILQFEFMVMKSQRITYIISELKDKYLIEDNLRPWIIGFNGGKDSTALLQLVLLALKEIPAEMRKREIHVICNETLGENPVNVVGRGYPVPNNTFRWCTHRMKIKPTSRYIFEQVAENGEAIILVGTRRSESATRANTIKKHEIRGKRLTNHPNQNI